MQHLLKISACAQQKSPMRKDVCEISFKIAFDCELHVSHLFIALCREPAKFVAKLRELKTDKNILCFKCEMGAGHFSQSGRFDRLKTTALEFAFLLKTQSLLNRQPA